MATVAVADMNGPPASDLPDDIVDVGLLRAYLASLLTPVMSATRLELETTLFSDPGFKEKASRFAMDSSTMVAYITKERKVTIGNNEGDEPSTASSLTYAFHLPPTPPVSSRLLATLSLIKKRPTLDATTPIADQLHFVLLSSNNSSAPAGNLYNGTDGQLQTETGSDEAAAPYEGLRSLVHFGVTPWFESYINSKQGKTIDVSTTAGKKGADAQMGIPVAKRKFAELELSLLHLQQNVEIPEVHLVIQSPIQKAVEACRNAETRITVEAIEPQSLLTNVTFLNRLQSDVNTWIKEIQKVTKLSRDVSAGTASQEINFWLSMERALETIEAQLAGDEVNLVLDVLKSAKRFHATISFIADTGLKEATDTVQKYNALMKDFPLNDLLSATDLDKIRDSLYVIFGHMNKKLKVTPYPLRRTLPLVEAISRDFNDQCAKVLNSQRLLYLDYPTFDRVTSTAMEVFAAWEENIKEFTNVAREVMRKRTEKFIAVKINSAHTKLQERVSYVRVFRRNHEQLRAMTGPGGGLKALGFDAFTDIDMDGEVSQAYEGLRNAPVLDVTIEGTEIWVIGESAYNERISRVENQIILRLRDRLATARNAHEMFRIFSKFNNLFIRPKIRSAIQEYQTRLIDSVKQDIQRLHRKFTAGYRHSDALHMSQLRDLPPVASAIIWARQIEKQLNTDMKRVEDVLGKGWEMYADGEKLKTESEAFRKKLNPQPIFDAWIRDVTKREHRASGRLLEIVRQRNAPSLSDGQPALEIAVNFDHQTIALFKEVRNLLWLNYNVPHTVISMAKEAKRIYPHATILMESLRIYTQISELVEQAPDINILLAEHRHRAQDLIGKGMNIRWENVAYSYNAQRSGTTEADKEGDSSLAFFKEFANVVGALQEKSISLMDISAKVTRHIEELSECPYDFDSFAGILSRLQKIADDLNLQDFANLDAWVDSLDQRIQHVLVQRVSNEIDNWCQAFSSHRQLSVSDDDRQNAAMTNEPIVHELRIKNQLIYVDPPVEMTQATWMKQLQRIMGIVCGQAAIKSLRYELKLYEAETAGTTYQPILASLQDSLLLKPFQLIKQKVEEVQSYVAEWLRFQSLWDLNPETIYTRLGDELDQWSLLLSGIKHTRSTFDTAGNRKDFGVCLVIYAGVQGKVTAKYDSWQRDILAKYAAKLGHRMADFYAALSKARQELETQTLNGSSTAQAVSFITFVQDLNRKNETWSPELSNLIEGQEVLERQRYAFPDDWLHIERINGEWQMFNDILQRKNGIIEEQFAALQLKISAEVDAMDERVNTLQQDWDTRKPIQGNIKPELALDTIETFSLRLAKTVEGQALLEKAQDALHLGRRQEDRLLPMTDEIRDLKTVWTALLGISIRLNELRETLWTAINPRKLRQSLDNVLSSMKEMPSRMRQYAAYEHFADTIKALLKGNSIVSDLKSDALRDRHWRTLFQVLRISSPYRSSTITLGQIWDLNTARNEKAIKDTILQAQGEMALEEYVRQVKDTWSNYTLDLINYRNKCRLIRGWDELFTTCRDQVTSLASMRASPYYKVFEEEASGLEDKLNRVHSLFDIWVDVQRQWVYLEGVFAGNADIKHLLPVESSRFNSINSEFLSTMAKVSKSPLVFDVLAINGVHKTLERLADALAKIQKGLGEYLERERAAFPRYFFLGDEDLLEIIGNSKDISRVAKHLGKMFAGIRAIHLNDSEDAIVAISSKEDERLSLVDTIRLDEKLKVNDWLSSLETITRATLRQLLRSTCKELKDLYVIDQPLETSSFLSWIERFPDQLVILAIQIVWTESVERQLTDTHSVQEVLQFTLSLLDSLSGIVLHDLNSLVRRKCEHLIVELAHQRDVLRALLDNRVTTSSAFDWQKQMRFYHYMEEEDVDKAVVVKMADAVLPYGFEYLGIPERLVQTPLTDKCYLILTQALHSQCGGSPFGPAGTGKTESVKALGAHLGRFVLVFCCDETFDFQAMGRLFSGICQVGAWGCFDEFNRLEEKMLSAVSQQIQTIQQALDTKDRASTEEVVLADRRLLVRPDTGIFITMNPDYAGRSQLPSNLKKLFRSVAMTFPDRQLIAQVTLFAQGFRHAEAVAARVVPFFQLCQERLSQQAHYDFGLRALKSVLTRAGILKRLSLASDISNDSRHVEEADELGVLVQSIREALLPKLIGKDVQTMESSILQEIFPGITPYQQDLEKITNAIRTSAAQGHLVLREQWVTKIVQLYQIQQISHGIMLVGGTATGKSQAWRTLLQALQKLDGVESISYLIDPKAISKDSLYGTLDVTTREWTDGLFTSILRRILEDARGESAKRHYIVFDGDVDPEWIENLNSVLDDNKLLTLPNGERLNLPPNVRVLFEVEHLNFATPATVSRCGMVWFSDDILDVESIYQHYMTTLEEDELQSDDVAADIGNMASPSILPTQKIVAQYAREYIDSRHLLRKAVAGARDISHIMEFGPARCLSTLFSSLCQDVRDIYRYDRQHPDFPLTSERIKAYLSRKLLLDLTWAFAGDADGGSRAKLGLNLAQASGVDLPFSLTGSDLLLNYTVDISTGLWQPWSEKVPTMEVDVQNITATDVVIPTVDTLRHEALVYSWIRERKPVILCGPPGSGKTMTLFNALRKLPDIEVAGLNFSSATSPELVLRTFEQYCEYKKTPKGIVLSPTSATSWLMVFCDEINLPAPDTYGTQRVISFMRQMVEEKGFWRTSDLTWIHLERVQFIGACNPPSDSGRTALSSRFLRHAPVLYVDYPEVVSLTQIYGAYVRAVLKVAPNLRGYAQPLTQAMVDFYQASKRRFTSDRQAHYIYSPRELTRWIRGIYETLRSLEDVDVEGLVRIWAHEALRLFQDRLVEEEEKTWTDDKLDEVAMLHFPTIDQEKALSRPILFSNWTTQHYQSIDREALREYTKARLRTFYEEEMDVQLVLFDDVLDHVLRIDRVFRQTQGHMLLIGISGGGKTTLSRFVAWMNGLSIYQLQVSSQYTAADFDDDLRQVLRRAGCKGEKICFIMDESNVLDSGFLERMNTLLANAEIPGLFDGEEYTALMTACREGSQRDGLILDSNDELYRWFTRQIASNLHVVFTMNPPAHGLRDRVATSPALFNRCVLDWFGDWSTTALNQVASELTSGLDLDKGESYVPVISDDPGRRLSYSMAIVSVMVHAHEFVLNMSQGIAAETSRIYHVTPRHFLDFIAQFVKLYLEKKEKFEEQQRHINIGLEKLHDTLTEVELLQSELSVKGDQLKTKDEEANRKLRQMIADQQQAEAKKLRSVQIQQQLEEQQAMIAQRKEGVLLELEEVEPMVQEAAGAVANIKKAHLAEVRAMGNPPETVKIAVESACIVLGFKVDGWKAVQSVIRRDDFTSMVRNFDSEKISPATRNKIEREYMTLPNFNVEAADRASKACGPLVQWVFAQVRYSAILDKVGPLRDEVTFLEHQAETTMEQAKIALETVQQLEESIARYKDEYAQLISETQTIKLEMRQVQDRVTRSTSLLSSLSTEQERWTRDSEQFETEIANIPGDVLQSSIFLTYAGWFDQHNRLRLLNHCRTRMTDHAILHRSKLSLPDFLSSIDERSEWANAGLAVDDLTVENALILKRFNRYPLIIDPTDQATTFLTGSYGKGKLIVTSFLDSAFIKNLETALRFGNALLIQNAEDLNPVLNPVLNKEIRKTGGRNLVRLGNQDVDFSPSFVMFLSTRDAAIEIGADVSSRTTNVNFSMTPSSLFSQSLDKILKAESPEIYRKRRDLQKIQSGYQVKLRHLEESLLHVLNECNGHILEDDKVITTLETVKQEAAIVGKKVADAETVMDGIEEKAKEYTSIARAASDIFFLLARLPKLHHFYRFSLDFFLHIFDTVLLNNPRLRQMEGSKQRQHAILEDLFTVTMSRVQQGLLHEDYSILSVFLASIYLSALGDPEKASALLWLIQSNEDDAQLGDDEPDHTIGRAFESLPFLELGIVDVNARQHFLGAPDAWQNWLASATPELHTFGEGLDDISISILRINLVSRLRRDRLDIVLRDFMGTLIKTPSDTTRAHDMEILVKHEVPAGTPIIFSSVPGHDASSQVEALVARMNATCASVAMGSAEGVSAADQAISIAARNGSWVLLKNLHLASHWLHHLERRLRSLNIHRDFRLFLTMETTTSIPASIIETSRIIMNEPTPGIRANLLESLTAIRPDQGHRAPNEKDRMYFLLAWLHTVLLERSRYLPIGFTKSYGFNDSDLAAGRLMLDRWIGYEAKGRSNIDPKCLPWDAMRALLADNIYGGKVDTPEDLSTIRHFVLQIMTADAFESGFSLTTNGESPEIGDISRFEQFMQWAEALPFDQPVSWLELPPHSDKIVAATQGRNILTKCAKLLEKEGGLEGEVDQSSNASR